MKTKLILVVAMFMLINTGCGTSEGFLRDSATFVALEKGNFKYVQKNVSASEKMKVVFCGMPGHGKLINKTLGKLHETAGLTENQTFVNLRRDTRVHPGFIGFGCSITATVSADVVEFTN